MNTPIYDRLVAELREQHTTTVPFRRPAAAPAGPAGAARDWFAPAEPAPARVEPTPPPGLQGIARILSMARVGLDVQDPRAVVVMTGTVA
ncbi:hypothetical protein [Nonomuraea sp. JJY05]|uniref:hypothetical protein n=1 Tax=Nonomuraea sp. JJY05 TaxID=3350255 RepID=UPI00373EFD79